MFNKMSLLNTFNDDTTDEDQITGFRAGMAITCYILLSLLLILILTFLAIGNDSNIICFKIIGVLILWLSVLLISISFTTRS